MPNFFSCLVEPLILMFGKMKNILQGNAFPYFLYFHVFNHYFVASLTSYLYRYFSVPAISYVCVSYSVCIIFLPMMFKWKTCLMPWDGYLLYLFFSHLQLLIHIRKCFYLASEQRFPIHQASTTSLISVFTNSMPNDLFSALPPYI